MAEEEGRALVIIYLRSVYDLIHNAPLSSMVLPTARELQWISLTSSATLKTRHCQTFPTLTSSVSKSRKGHNLGSNVLVLVHDAEGDSHCHGRGS